MRSNNSLYKKYSKDLMILLRQSEKTGSTHFSPIKRAEKGKPSALTESSSKGLHCLENTLNALYCKNNAQYLYSDQIVAHFEKKALRFMSCCGTVES